SGPLKWSSSAPGIVAVDANGRVTGVALGAAIIRAYSDDGIAETRINVVAGGGTLRAGYSTTCGVTVSDGLYCWGDNSRGQVGAGNTVTPQPTPPKVAGGLTFTSVSVGSEHV